MNKRIKRMFLARKSSYIGMLLLLSTACYLGFKTPMTGIRQGVLDNREISKLEDAGFSLSVPMSDTMLSLYENLFSLSLEKCPSVEIDEGYQGAALRLFPKAQKMNLPSLYEGKDIADVTDILVDRYFFNAQGLSFGDTVMLYGKAYTGKGYFHHARLSHRNAAGFRLYDGRIKIRPCIDEPRGVFRSARKGRENRLCGTVYKG